MRIYRLKYFATILLMSVMVSSCSSWSNTTNGTLIGTVGGAVVGAGLGGALGDRHSAAFGAHLGSQIGMVAGTAIGAEADVKERRKAQKQYQTKAMDSRVFVDEYSGKRYYRANDMGDILFRSRDSQLNSRSQRALNGIANRVKKIKGIIYVYGSTDDVESRDYCQQLSLERARAAAGYLIACGVPRNRIKVKGLGDSSPLADNSTMEGRALNRCAEIYVELE